MNRTHPPADTDLRVFRDPASVAVVGATADPAKWGYWLAKGALAGRHRREVYLVNHSGAEILGRASHRCLGELPATPELVALCVPPAHIGAVVDEALALGARGFLGITAGVPDEAAIARRIIDAGARLVGMNSLGIYDSSTELRLAWGEFTPGSIAVISQSGQFGSEIANLAARAGLGVSRFVSIGNQTDVRAGELLVDLIADGTTRVVALYLESFSAGEHLMRPRPGCARRGKYTVLLTVGGSEASTRLARSHTGSLTSNLDVVDAAARAAGVVRVNTPSELVEVARLLLASALPAGNRVAIVGDSGGQTGIAADVAAAATLRVPAFSDRLEIALAQLLPDGAACSNPVDLAGAGEKDLACYADVISLLLDSDEVDSVVLTGYFGSYGVDTPSLAGRELEIVDAMGVAVIEAGKPLIVQTMVDATRRPTRCGNTGSPSRQHRDGHPRAGGRRPARPGRTPLGQARGPHRPHRRRLSRRPESVDRGGNPLPARDCRASAHGPRRRARAADAPYVLKASWLEHKSEVGGVRVGSRTWTRSPKRSTPCTLARPGDYVVEELDARRHTVEMLVGARRDPDLGPIVVVGAGGTEAEVYRDVTVEMAPVDTETA